MAGHEDAAGQHVLQRRWTRQQEVDPGLLQVVHVCGIVHVALGIHVAPAQRATITVSHLCALLARSRSRNAVVVALHELRPKSARSARGRSSVITPPIGAAIYRRSQNRTGSTRDRTSVSVSVIHAGEDLCVFLLHGPAANLLARRHLTLLHTQFAGQYFELLDRFPAFELLVG